VALASRAEREREMRLYSNARADLVRRTIRTQFLFVSHIRRELCSPKENRIKKNRRWEPTVGYKTLDDPHNTHNNNSFHPLSCCIDAVIHNAFCDRCKIIDGCWGERRVSIWCNEMLSLRRQPADFILLRLS